MSTSLDINASVSGKVRESRLVAKVGVISRFSEDKGVFANEIGIGDEREKERKKEGMFWGEFFARILSDGGAWIGTERKGSFFILVGKKHV